MGPLITVVILTWNEEPNIEACLAALAAQREKRFEVVLVDAASTDRTVALARKMQPSLPFPLSIDVAQTRTSVGAARNRGATLATTPFVAFLSADAEAQPDWTEEALIALQGSDLVFGRQVHTPSAPGIAAAVRGLRYHFPGASTTDPTRYASHVNAAMRLALLQRFPHGTDAAASAVDDILLAKRALGAGYTATYHPAMVVLHRDVHDVRAELRKNWREGLGWGAHRRELGVHRLALAWAGLLSATLLVLLIVPGLASALLFAAALFLPGIRRAVLRRRALPLATRVLGVLATPIFDLAFLVNYLRSLARAPRAARALHPAGPSTQEPHP